MEEAITSSVLEDGSSEPEPRSRSPVPAAHLVEAVVALMGRRRSDTMASCPPGRDLAGARGQRHRGAGALWASTFLLLANTQRLHLAPAAGYGRELDRALLADSRPATLEAPCLEGSVGRGCRPRARARRLFGQAAAAGGRPHRRPGAIGVLGTIRAFTLLPADRDGVSARARSAAGSEGDRRRRRALHRRLGPFEASPLARAMDGSFRWTKSGRIRRDQMLFTSLVANVTLAGGERGRVAHQPAGLLDGGASSGSRASATPGVRAARYPKAASPKPGS